MTSENVWSHLAAITKSVSRHIIAHLVAKSQIFQSHKLPPTLATLENSSICESIFSLLSYKIIMVLSLIHI